MQSPTLYRAFYVLRLAKKAGIRLPRATDDLYVDGYPRSGNSYLFGLIRFFYPRLSFAHHLHTPAALAIALKKRIPTVVLVREPSDAIASNAHRKQHMQKRAVNGRLLDQLIDDYIGYYRFVLSHSSSLSMVNFMDLKNDPLSVLRSQISCYGMETPRYPINEIALKAFQSTLEEREKTKPLGATSLPDGLSVVEKIAYRELVMSRPMYLEAFALYERLFADRTARTSA